ncbi:MAG: ATP-dependent RNA helicase HrpA, partial [Desulfosudaceae bacterium]
MTDQTVKNIRRLLPRALRVDRLPARRRLERLLNGRGNKSAEAVARDLERLQQRLEKSANLKSGRYESFPANLPDARLPISEKRAEIIEAVKSNPVVIVAGATGSGKTTQIPKYCVAAGLGRDGRVGCTQPRRIAAISVASRISEEIGRPAGELVGYKIRFADQTAPGQLIKIMTDGILLAEAQQDRWLNEYDVLVIDEAHERSLNIDFILGLVQKILEKRADLKVVITSATIDTEKFSAAFNEAPVIEVSGRMYPVEVVYRPCDEKEAAAGDSDTENYVEAAVAEVDRICRENPGDILVFMPTTQDIRDACAMIKGRRYSGTVVLPLYARLSGPAQAAVFARRRERKIIVATNIAETSLTIPGIRHVVDTGLARISYYNPRTRITSLAVRKISQSSARQREGRCGRVANGTCIRLYSEKDFESRHLFTPPEILRSNLADAILRMMALGLGRIREFPFVDPPMEKSVSDGYDVLVELGAIQMAAGGKKSPGGRYRLTRQGRLMALIPVDPRLSRILIEAAARNCLAEAMVMVAALSVPDPRVEPSAHKDDAAAAQAGWTHPDSDFITLLNIWDACRDKRGGELKRFCRQQGLSFTRLREWRDVHNQIRELIQTHGIRPADGPKAAINRQAAPERFYAAFHKAVLSGYLSHIAEKKQDNTYQAAKSQEVMIFPGSALFNRGRSWIVSAEYMETTRRYARMVAAIERQWIPEIAGDLCR